MTTKILSFERAKRIRLGLDPDKPRDLSQEEFIQLLKFGEKITSVKYNGEVLWTPPDDKED